MPRHFRGNSIAIAVVLFLGTAKVAIIFHSAKQIHIFFMPSAERCGGIGDKFRFPTAYLSLRHLILAGQFGQCRLLSQSLNRYTSLKLGCELSSCVLSHNGAKLSILFDLNTGPKSWEYYRSTQIRTKVPRRGTFSSKQQVFIWLKFLCEALGRSSLRTKLRASSMHLHGLTNKIGSSTRSASSMHRGVREVFLNR